ncbi:hypothetical protein EC973_003034 [Apophysomyces ossiformis]|uniref:Uncharacterized protein n=1 Tax=Apophysomyces ossiformis TaxID=679940 RepID=A0A8H7BTB1_9FUNG|nr:hypothetical protein EC973_003034 [Apophysomyces ossiformis]
MTLAALSHNPPSTPAHYQTPNSKWRKGLALFAKYSANSKKQWTPTTLAAATEKFIRHRPSPSPEIKCEDLTAKEFAELAGIKIKSPSETDPDLLSTTQHHLTVRTAISSDLRTCPRIWDSDFWYNECPQQQAPQPIPIQSSSYSYHTVVSSIGSSSSSSGGSTAATSYASQDFISHLRRHSTQEDRPICNVIHKGRFKIVVGQDDEEEAEPIQPPCEQVVEWRRKRAATE